MDGSCFISSGLYIAFHPIKRDEKSRAFKQWIVFIESGAGVHSFPLFLGGIVEIVLVVNPVDRSHLLHFMSYLQSSSLGITVAVGVSFVFSTVFTAEGIVDGLVDDCVDGVTDGCKDGVSDGFVEVVIGPVVYGFVVTVIVGVTKLVGVCGFDVNVGVGVVISDKDDKYIIFVTGFKEGSIDVFVIGDGSFSSVSILEISMFPGVVTNPSTGRPSHRIIIIRIILKKIIMLFLILNSRNIIL